MIRTRRRKRDLRRVDPILHSVRQTLSPSQASSLGQPVYQELVDTKAPRAGTHQHEEKVAKRSPFPFYRRGHRHERGRPRPTWSARERIQRPASSDQVMKMPPTSSESPAAHAKKSAGKAELANETDKTIRGRNLTYAVSDSHGEPEDQPHQQKR